MFIVVCCIIVALGSAAALQRIVKVFCPKSWSYKLSTFIIDTYPRLMFACMKTYAGFTLEFDKTLKDRLPDRFLLISNHQSLLDIIIYTMFFDNRPLRFVAKQELGRGVPLISLLMRTHGHCLLARKGSAVTMMRTLDDFARRCADQRFYPAIFPEGTRSKNGEVGTFHAAGFRRLEDASPLPVVTAALDGGWKIASLSDMMKNLPRGGYKVKIMAVSPAPESKAEQLRVLDEGKALIENQLRLWRRQEA